MEIIIISVSIFLGSCLGFLVAVLMAEAKRNDKTEEINEKSTEK